MKDIVFNFSYGDNKQELSNRSDTFGGMVKQALLEADDKTTGILILRDRDGVIKIICSGKEDGANSIACGDRYIAMMEIAKTMIMRRVYG